MSWTFRSGVAAVSLAGLLLAGAAAAYAHPGSEDAPIVLHMKRGTDTIRVEGVLRQDADCCTYQFSAHAGQKLTVRETGAAARLVLTYPDGQGEGPGLADKTVLPQDGIYLLSVSPNLMAEGAYGRFTLRITIPPAGRH